MNRHGFTLVELLATLVVLGIIMGIVVVSVNGNFGDAKNQTEDVFVATIEDALDVYLDSDAKKLEFPYKSEDSFCTLNKTHGSVSVFKSSTVVTFYNVINSTYHPIAESDLINPANKDVACANSSDITVNVYRDSDFVYYYSIDGKEFQKDNDNCLKKTKIITNLPCDCLEKMKKDGEISELPCYCLLSGCDE